MTAAPGKPAGKHPGKTAEPTSGKQPADSTHRSAADAFDLLYERQARGLTRQALLLCGHRRVAEAAVTHGFHQVWQHWPKVAVDRDPASWVRTSVYAYALSPWHQFLPGRCRPDAHAGPPGDRALLDALLGLPRVYRAALLLHDGVGLSLPDTAAETQASTPAAAGRLAHARDALAEQLPPLRTAPQDRRAQLLAGWLRELAAAQPVRLPTPQSVRSGSEHTTRHWTRAALALTLLVATATGLTVAGWEDRGSPEQRGPGPDSAVTPARSHTDGRSGTSDTPGGSPGGPNRPGRPSSSGAATSAALPEDSTFTMTARLPATPYLPQLRSTNRRMDRSDLERSGDLRDRVRERYRNSDQYERQ